MKASLDYRDGRIACKFIPTPAALTIIKGLDPRRRFDPVEKCWWFPAEPLVLTRLCNFFGMDVRATVYRWAHSIVDEGDAEEQLKFIRSLLGPDLVRRAPPKLELVQHYPWITAPYEHQRGGLALLAEHPVWGLFWEQGCVHPHTLIKCQRSGMVATIQEWNDSGNLPVLTGYNRDGGLVDVQASRVIVKPASDYIRVVLPGREVVVGENHLFLVKRAGKLLLERAWEIKEGDSLAISGPGSITGTSTSSEKSTLKSKPTGLDLFWETDLSMSKGLILNSRSRLQKKTPTISSGSRTTSSSPESLSGSSMKDTPHGRSISSETNSEKHWLKRECPSRASHTEPSLTYQFGSEAISGEGFLTLTAQSVKCKKSSADARRLFSRCATLHRQFCEAGLIGLLLPKPGQGRFAEGMERGKSAALAEEMRSGWPTGCTVMQPSFCTARLPNSERHGSAGRTLSADRDAEEKSEHIIPVSCRNLSFLPILRLEHVGRGPVYDLTVPGIANYFDAAGINHQNTGKTKVIADRIRWGLESGEFGTGRPIVIFCPKPVVQQWPKELMMHAGLESSILLGDKKRRQKVLDNVMSYGGTPIFITNYEAVGVIGMDLTRTQPIAVIADETHLQKRSTTQISMGVRRIAAFAKYRWALSGTPAPNSPLDIFGTLLFLDPAVAGTQSKTAFEATYAIRGRLTDKPKADGSVDHRQAIIGYQNLDDLQRRVASISSYLRKEDCLDLPPKVFQDRFCELEGQQRETYIRLREDAVVTLRTLQKEGILTVPNILTEQLRLLQVVGGFVPDNDGVKHALTPNAKLDLFKEVAEDTENSVIVWCAFREELFAVMEYLAEQGESAVSFYGDTTDAERALAVERFQNRQVRWFVGTSAGGTGLNLQAAETMIYYSRNFKLTTYLQSQDRAHRIGQTKTLRIIHLRAAGTVDDKVHAALELKAEMQDSLLRDADVEEFF